MINNVYGMLRAAERGLGVGSLPDYLCSASRRLVRVLPQLEGPTFDAFFVYAAEMRESKRVRVFRIFCSGRSLSSQCGEFATKLQKCMAVMHWGASRRYPARLYCASQQGHASDLLKWVGRFP